MEREKQQQNNKIKFEEMLTRKPNESAHKGVNQCSKDVTQAQQQRPESPTVILTWYTCKYEVHKLHHRYIIK